MLIFGEKSLACNERGLKQCEVPALQGTVGQVLLSPGLNGLVMTKKTRNTDNYSAVQEHIKLISLSDDALEQQIQQLVMERTTRKEMAERKALQLQEDRNNALVDVLTKELVEVLCPEHSHTSCFDQSNGFRAVTHGDACPRCCLEEAMHQKYIPKGLCFTVVIK